MRKDVQEALESAIAEFEKRQQAEQARLRERERFETDWARIRTAVVLPALEEVAALLRKAGWQCEVRAADKDPGVHLTVYRWGKAGASGGEKPFMIYQPEKQKDTVLLNVATRASAAPVGSFALDKITEDSVDGRQPCRRERRTLPNQAGGKLFLENFFGALARVMLANLREAISNAQQHV